MGFSFGGTPALNQMNSIASSAAPCSTDIFAQYTYLGDGTIVGVAHPAVSGGLNLTYGSASDSGGAWAAWPRLRPADLAGLAPALSAKLRRPAETRLFGRSIFPCIP